MELRNYDRPTNQPTDRPGHRAHTTFSDFLVRPPSACPVVSISVHIRPIRQLALHIWYLVIASWWRGCSFALYEYNAKILDNFASNAI